MHTSWHINARNPFPKYGHFFYPFFVEMHIFKGQGPGLWRSTS